MTRKLLLLSLLLSIAAAGCYYDTAEELYSAANQNIACDTSAVTYSVSIAPVINASCNSCHDKTHAAANGNVTLDDYSHFSAVATGGRLMGSIRQQPGFFAMPNNGGKLSECNIAIIQKWINMGAPNN
jgi:cytochrome c5